MDEDALVERSMAIVRPIIEREGRVVARAEEMFRDLTGATTALWQADMAEVDRQWWYRIARISLGQEGARER